MALMVKVRHRPMDPHVAIMWAAERGQGLRLTAEEVWQLSRDDAIATRATCILHESSPPKATE